MWFGESVPMLEAAAKLAEAADYFIIVGTSLQVYPAASLMIYADPSIPYFYIDPRPQLNHELKSMKNLEVIAATGSEGVGKVAAFLLRSGL